MKKSFLKPKTALFFVLALFLILTSCTTNEWPRFRGPDDNMVINRKDLPDQWSDSLNIKWSAEMIGESWSSPIVYGDKVFFSSAVQVKKAPEKPKNEENDQQQEDKNRLPEDVYRWQLTCLDLESGEELWNVISREGTPRIRKHAGSTYACESPVTDGKHVWVYYGMHGVYCYDMNGNLVWEQDPGAYPTAKGWGTGSSPVLYNNTLYVLVDNEENSFLVAYNASTGAEKWKVSRDEKTSYSTPVIWKNNVRTELVTLGSKARSYNPENGELIWEMKFNVGRAATSPVFDSEIIYVGLSGGPRDIGPLHAVKAGASGNLTQEENYSNAYFAWSDTLAGLGYPSPVLYEGKLYVLADRGGEITCFDAATGQRIYKEKAGKAAACWASPWIVNDKLYFYDEKGETQIIQVEPEFKVMGSNKLDDKFWATVAVAGNNYILKGVDKIYCIGK